MKASKVFIVVFVGLVLAVSVVAEPLVEGRVRLASGVAVAAAQVMVFDLTDLQRGPVAQATTDAGDTSRYRWAVMRYRMGLRWGRIIPIRSTLPPSFRISCPRQHVYGWRYSTCWGSG